MFSTLLAYVSSGFGLIANIFFQDHAPKDSSEKQSLLCDLRSTLLQVNKQSSHQTFTLPGDRTLGFATFGAEAGPIVFFLHGFGDSRLLGALFHEPGKAQGLRWSRAARRRCRTAATASRADPLPRARSASRSVRAHGPGWAPVHARPTAA